MSFRNGALFDVPNCFPDERINQVDVDFRLEVFEQAPRSHGCIRMRNADLVELFDLVPAYTPVEIVAA